MILIECPILVLLNLLGPYECLGELADLSSQPRPAGLSLYTHQTRAHPLMLLQLWVIETPRHLNFDILVVEKGTEVFHEKVHVTLLFLSLNELCEGNNLRGRGLFVLELLLDLVKIFRSLVLVLRGKFADIDIDRRFLLIFLILI
jgi:hypothetical protein